METVVSFNVTLMFTTYGYPGPIKYLFFTFTFLLYAVSVFANMFLMVVIYVESSLHKPMYGFLFNLSVNGVIGSSAVWLKVMENLLSDTQTITHVACMVQVFFINVYATSAYLNLTVMAYDRYVSICKPLRYHSIMTPWKVKQLLVLVYFVPICSVSAQVYFTARLPLCRFTIQKLFCDNLTLINLSCVKSSLVNVYSICLIVALTVFPLFLVLLSYAKILSVCLKTSKDSRKKALSTCTPHLITFINFSFATLFSVIYNRISYNLPEGVTIFMSLHFVLVPPLLNPVIYGIRTQEIRKCIAKILSRNRIFAGPFAVFHQSSKLNLTPANPC